MRLSKEKPSKRVGHYVPAPTSNPDGKRSNERIFKTPEFRRAIEDVSSAFQANTMKKGGKTHRENKMGLHPEEMEYIRSKFGKKK